LSRSSISFGDVYRVFAVSAVLVLAGCGSGFLGETETKAPLKGDRIPIMLVDREIAADPAIESLEVRLPKPMINRDWPQPGGDASHVVGHPQTADVLSEAWSSDIGEGGGDLSNLVTAPVVVEGRVFTIDANGVVSAFATDDGRRLWHFETKPKDEEETIFAGGITLGEGRLFAMTGYGEAVALDPEFGEEVWRVRLPGLPRGSPTVAEGRLFVTTKQNQMAVMSTEDGSKLWSHAGISEVSALLGGASPAVGGGAVIVPYSSGELFVLKVENGRVLWVESLTRIRALGGISNLADIRGHPVLDSGMVIAVSHAGRLFSTDLKSGVRIWERRVASVNTPWVAGDFIYVVSIQGEVLCLTRRDGRVRWVTRLPEFTDVEDREGPIQYAGPVLAGDRLLVADSEGHLTSISPYTGEITGELDVGGKIFVAPVVADGTVYVLRDDATLIAYR
jgi:outer membrane protein assembly factor BamB